MPDTLKPCPFCGGEAKIHSAPNDAAIVFGYCNSCGTEGPWISSGDRSEARAAWNSRPSPSPEVEALVEALDALSTYAASIRWKEGDNTEDWLKGLEVRISNAQLLTAAYKESQR